MSYLDQNEQQTFGDLVTFSNGVAITDITHSEILSLDSNNNVVSLPVATYPSLTELSYLKGVTSSIQTQINNILGEANALVYKGVIDCSTNPNYPAADAGWLYIVSVAGKIGGASGVEVEVGDLILCNTDSTASGNQATVGIYWNVIQKNISGAVTGPASSVDNGIALFDSTTGKVIKDSAKTIVTTLGVDDSTVPTSAAVNTGLSLKANQYQRTSDPSIADDGEGTNGTVYRVSDVWINTATDSVFICTDSTEIAAVWKKIVDTDVLDTLRKYTTVGVYGTEPTFTDNNDGTADLGGFDVLLKSNTNGLTTIEKYTIAASGPHSFTDGISQYLYVDYNGGTPIVALASNANSFDYATKVPIYKCWRTGNTIHSLSGDAPGVALPEKIAACLQATQPYSRAGSTGLIISESSRVISITESYVYAGTFIQWVQAYTSATDLYTMASVTNGTWSFTTSASTYDNTQYNPLTGPTTLTAAYYGIRWHYRSIGNVKETFYVLGTGNHKRYGDAELESERSDLPLVIKQHCVLVGRSIIQNGASAGITDSAFDVKYCGASIISHNDTNNIQGGNPTTNNYYHSDQAINSTDNPTFTDVFISDLNRNSAEVGLDTHINTGIPWDQRSRFKVAFTYDAGNIIATISFVGANTSFSYYLNDKKFTVTATELSAYTQTAVASEGTWFLYVNQSTTDVASPVISLTKTPWSIYDPDVLLWNAYFEATGNTFMWVGEERHTAGRDIFQHARNHSQGALYKNGLTFSQYNGLTNLSGNTNNNFGRTMIQISGGSFFDEDILNTIVHSDASYSSTVDTPSTNWGLTVEQFLGFTALADTGTNATTIVFPTSRTLATGQAITVMAGNTTTVRGTTTITTGGTGTTFTVTSVTGLTTGDAIVVGGRMPIYYFNAGTNLWRKLATGDFTVVKSNLAATTTNIATGVAQYNNATNGTFTNGTSNRYIPMYLLATNNTSEPVIAICGQGQSTTATLSTALTQTPFQFQNLSGLTALPFQEVVPFYRITFLNTNNQNPRISDASFINLRVATVTGTVIGTGTTAVSGTDVSLDISNFNRVLTATETNAQLAFDKIDDQAVNKDGVAGGQTIIGGTAASENLTLQSTSDATRGTIIANDDITLGTTTYRQAAQAISWSSGTFTLENGLTDVATFATTLIALIADSVTISRGLIINSTATDSDFTINKNSSGQALLYDAGADTFQINSETTIDVDSTDGTARKALDINAFVTGAGTGDAVGISIFSNVENASSEGSAWGIYSEAYKTNGDTGGAIAVAAGVGTDATTPYGVAFDVDHFSGYRDFYGFRIADNAVSQEGSTGTIYGAYIGLISTINPAVLKYGIYSKEQVYLDNTQLTISKTTNQLTLGTTNTVTISSTAPAASRTYTIPDKGVDATFLLSSDGNVADQLDFFIESPTNKSYVIRLRTNYAGTITYADCKTSAGTCTANFRIDTTSITSLGAIAVTSVISNTQATAANTFTANQTIDVVLTSVSGATDLAISLRINRTV